ncbi:MAG: glycosyltransferase family 4 protein [Verrucomicrobiota bacterium]
MRPKTKVIYIPMYYPVLYQTFLRREISGMVKAGCEIQVAPCLPGGDVRVRQGHPIFRPGWRWLTAPLEWIRWYGSRPGMILRGIRQVLQHPPGYLESWFFLVWSVLYAPLIASLVKREKIQHIHAAWATAPASVAWLAHKLCGISFSFGAQAYDLYRMGGDNFLLPKCRDAKFIHTTTQNNVQTLTEKSPDTADKIVLARRGLGAMPPPRVTGQTGEEIRLLSVGRLVPKKGHRYQLEACRILKEQGRQVSLKLVGAGALQEELRVLVHKYGLEREVEFCGAAAPEEVVQYYAWADIFWHTGIVDGSGDRDGLPNVVPEAMGHEVPVICGVEVGVLEAISDRITGLVVDPADTDQLARAVIELKDNPALRNELTLNARQWVQEHFLAEKNAAKIAAAVQA